MHTDLRPATDRVRQTIFNVLQTRLSLIDANILDMFAGTGSLGLEALSRGAGHVTFVDSSFNAVDLIEANIKKLGCTEFCSVVRSDALRFMEGAQTSFDLIFADPPYRYEETASIPGKIFSMQLLKKSGFLIIEHSKACVFQETEAYTLTTQRTLGQTVVSFFTELSQ